MGGINKLRVSLLGLAAILAAGSIFYLCLPKEPRYQGRTLTDWLDQANTAYALSRGKPQNDPQWLSASNAVQQIGADAIPLLLKWVSANDSKPKAALILWLDSNPKLHFHVRSAAEYQITGHMGFALLGTKAKPAWPALVQLTSGKEPGRRFFGLFCLLVSKADKELVLPVCLRLIKDPDKSVQLNTAYWFHFFYPQEAEAAGVCQLAPELKSQPIVETDTNRPIFR